MKSRLIIVLVLITLLLTGIVPENSAYAGTCTWHVVKRGDNLTKISRQYGVTVKAIVRANNIKNPNRIYRGQRLCIPKAGPKPPAPSPYVGCTKIHIVRPGEYLKEIAIRYHTTVNAIVRMNGIKNPSRIYTGQRLVIPVPCPRPHPKPTPKPPVTQPWRGQYWTNRDLAGNPKFIRYQRAISFNWGMGGPQGLGKVDNFSMRWTRSKYFEGGRYLFHVKTKDAVRVFVDGQLLIGQWHDVPHATNYTAEKELSTGHHKLQVDYYAGFGPAQVHLQIERLGPPPPPGPGRWHAEYWNNRHLQGKPSWTTTYPDVVFNWGKGSPHPGIAADYFSARYTGEFHFADGEYRFYAVSDDGVRIWLDDKLILDQWRVQARTGFVSDVHVPEGNHKIKVEYFENTGAAFLKVLWSKK